MMNAYEAIYLVDAQLVEDQVNAIVEKYNAIITRNGGEVDDVDIWDPRRTAYEVKGRREARYVVVNFRSEPAAKDEVVRIFGISDDVLRSMVIRQDPRADSQPSRARAAERAAEQERRERETVAAPPPAPVQPPAEVAESEAVVDAEVSAEAPVEAAEGNE
jgi:small subunit ribosomal protein S6